LQSPLRYLDLHVGSAIEPSTSRRNGPRLVARQLACASFGEDDGGTPRCRVRSPAHGQSPVRASWQLASGNAAGSGR